MDSVQCRRFCILLDILSCGHILDVRMLVLTVALLLGVEQSIVIGWLHKAPQREPVHPEQPCGTLGHQVILSVQLPRHLIGQLVIVI
jgi:hypothetical protein